MTAQRFFCLEEENKELASALQLTQSQK